MSNSTAESLYSDEMDKSLEKNINNKFYYHKRQSHKKDSGDSKDESESYEEKFSQALTNTTSQSPQTRELALQHIYDILKPHRYMPVYVQYHTETLLDCIEKSIRRGKSPEQALAVKLAPLLVQQLGGHDHISMTLKKLLITIQDKSDLLNHRSWKFGGSLERSGDSNSKDEPLNERFEEEFSQALENATEKSAQTRALGLQSICEMLMHRYMPDYVDDRKVTLMDCIEKSIRRGKDSEQEWAARLAPLLALQLGGDEDIAKTLNKFLVTTVQDKSVSFDVRAKCCTALGLLNFIGGNVDSGDLLKLMQIFEGVFSGSYLKGDDKTPISVSADAGTLHAQALASWGLLLTMIPSADLVSLMTSGQAMPSFKNLIGLLQSPHLDVRIIAGETVALVLESGRAHDEDFLNEYLHDLIDAVKQLATDSHKYRAKRDLKAQRATFRDVLRYLEDNISLKITIRFGSESLLLDSWTVHHQYSALCVVMGPGMNTQLQENQFIRELFDLGTKPTASRSDIEYAEKRFINAAASKARTISRARNRDERSAVFN